MNICLIEWQQCMVKQMNYTMLYVLSEILRFLDSFLPVFDNNGSEDSVSPCRR